MTLVFVLQHSIPSTLTVCTERLVKLILKSVSVLHLANIFFSELAIDIDM